MDVNLDYVLARNMDDFADAMDRFCVSLHVCYADRRGNVGYWMSGLDPVRTEGQIHAFHSWGMARWSGLTL